MGVDLREENGGGNDEEDEEHAASDVELEGVVDCGRRLRDTLGELVRAHLTHLELLESMAFALRLHI